MTANYVLLTGTTGNIGSFLAHKFLSGFYKVILLVRPKINLNIEDRIKKIFLKHFYSEKEYELYKKNIIFINSDLEKEDCGFSDEDKKMIIDLVQGGNLVNIYHSAANVDFTLHDSPNIILLKNILDFFLKNKIIDKIIFNHISSTFVTRKKKGINYEIELKEEEKDHISAYDKSKFESEIILYDYKKNQNLNYRIFRISALIGARDNGKIIRFNSIYIPLLFIKRFKDKIISDIIKSSEKTNKDIFHNIKGNKYDCFFEDDGFLNLNFRFNFYTQTAINLVPIDFVAESIMHISKNPDSKNLIFNLVSRNRLNIIDFFNILFKQERIRGVKFIDPEDQDIEDPNHFEEVFNKFYISSGFDMMMKKSCGVYDMTNTINFIKNSRIEIPEINFQHLLLCYNYANINMKWEE